jgi:DNA repair exonuclease SbcCD ATPase subunit
VLETDSTQPKTSIAALVAVGRRIGDPELVSAIRAVSYAATRDSQALADAQKTSGELSSRLAIVTRQRDEAVRELRDLPARLERLGTEYRKAIKTVTERDAALAQRDAVIADLRKQLAAAPVTPKPTAPKGKPTPPQATAAEVELVAQRAGFIEELNAALAEAKRLGPEAGAAERARATALQTELAAIGVRLKAFRAARNST